MDFITKPSWLMDQSSLMEVINYQLYLPKDFPNPTSFTDVNAFNSGLRQFLFWKGQLMPSLKAGTVFLAFLGPSGLKPPNVIDVTTALKNVVDLASIVEFYQGVNTNFLAISFSSPVQVTKILSNFKYFQDNVVLAVTHNNSPIHNFRLLWLPPLFDIIRVHHVLNRYTKSHRLKRESIGITGGAFAPTNVVSGTFALEPGGDIAKLPHLIQLPSPHKGCALLVIEGRPPLCLKCRAIGHTRKKCSMIKCTTCTKVHFPGAPCGVSSYSSIASRNITPSSDDDWLLGLSQDTLSEVSVPAPPEPLEPMPPIVSDDSYHPVSTSLPGMPHSSIIASSSAEPLLTSECDRTREISSTPYYPTLSKSVAKMKIPEPVVIPTSESSLTIHHNTSSSSTSSPPLTRSRAHKKQVFSSSVSSNKGLRSELIAFTPHSSLISHDTNSPLSLALPLDADGALLGEVEESMDSAVLEEGSGLSDIEVDLSSATPQDPISSRKRKLSRRIVIDSLSSAEGDDFVDSPSTIMPLSPTPSIEVDSLAPSPLVSALEEPLLSEEDSHLAKFFNVSTSDLLRLKDACPSHGFSMPIIKKLKILHNHSIPVLQAIIHPQFFNLAHTTISNRLKTLERHHPSSIQITDLFHMHDIYDRMDGISGTTLTPQLCTPDPFNINT